MRGHVVAIASVEHNTREPQALASYYLEAQLRAMDYTVGAQSYYCGDGEVRNLEVEIKGTAAPDQIVNVGARYDSAYSAPGANDNGSGSAMVLELARTFQCSRPRKAVCFAVPPNLRKAIHC